jgi:anti-anti-sigma factor
VQAVSNPILNSGPASPRALLIVRIPGEFGPILRLRGELTASTVESLRRELEMLIPMGHNAVTLDLSGCTYLDLDGILTVLETYKRLRDDGRRLMLVAPPDGTGRLLQVLGIDWLVPVFPSAPAGERALRGGGPAPEPPGSWSQARERTLRRWRAIYEALDTVPVEDTLRQVTSMFAFCERAEGIASAEGLSGPRCQVCPLYHALGAHPEDIGCRSILDPLVEALSAGQGEWARARIAAIIDLIEALPIRNGQSTPQDPPRG